MGAQVNGADQQAHQQQEHHLEILCCKDPVGESQCRYIVNLAIL